MYHIHNKETLIKKNFVYSPYLKMNAVHNGRFIQTNEQVVLSLSPCTVSNASLAKSGISQSKTIEYNLPMYCHPIEKFINTSSILKRILIEIIFLVFFQFKYFAEKYYKSNYMLVIGHT